MMRHLTYLAVLAYLSMCTTLCAQGEELTLTLDSIQGDVQIKSKNKKASAQTAKVGMLLRKKWELNVPADGAANLLFSDGSRLTISPDTHIIYMGGGRTKFGLYSASIMLSRGAIKAQTFDSLRLKIKSEAGRVTLSQSLSSIVATEDGSLVVSNYEGASVNLRSRGRSGEVNIKERFGARASKGHQPSQAQKLPESPSWIDELALSVLIVPDAPSNQKLTWSPSSRALRYYVEIFDSETLLLKKSVYLDKQVTHFDPQALPEGSYVVQVSSLSKAHLTSQPSTKRKLLISHLSILQPGGIHSGMSVLAGTEVSMASHITCHSSRGYSGYHLFLSQPGREHFRCVDNDSNELAKLSFDIWLPQVKIVSIRAVNLSTPSTPPRDVLVAGQEALVVLRVSTEQPLPKSTHFISSKGLVILSQEQQQAGIHTLKLEVNPNAGAEEYISLTLNDPQTEEEISIVTQFVTIEYQ